jgi:hypothetical protein
MIIYWPQPKQHADSHVTKGEFTHDYKIEALLCNLEWQR